MDKALVLIYDVTVAECPWLDDDCGWCGEEKIVTQPRDYCWPKWKGRDHG